MNNKLKELIQPYWVEEQQGVYIPLIDKVLLKENVPAMPYVDSMKYAKTNGVQIATRDDLLQIYLQKVEINKILKEHDGDMLDIWFGSSSECGSNNRWVVYFGSGICDCTVKSDVNFSRAVVDLKNQKDNMKQFNLEEYLKDPNKKVVTRDGRNARIICTDRKGTEYSVVALCTMSSGSEDCYFYFPSGRMYLSADSCLDLFFAPEKHEGWINLYKINSSISPGPLTYNTKKEAESATGNRPDYISTTKIEWEE